MFRTGSKPRWNGIELLEKVQKWMYFFKKTLFGSGAVTRNKTKELGLMIVLLKI